MSANAADRLQQHYVDNFRQLPWRSPPGGGAPDVYRVWLSEIMLQQTTVATVMPRFERFVRRWPTLEHLAAASDKEILGEWAGLGYYARARNLIACARAVATQGGFPDTEDRLRTLPGIGTYTAAAIAAIAFDRRSVPIDTNVTRVIARLHALERPSAAEVAALADELYPRDGCGDFAQALMDLGSMICRPREPRCGICPLTPCCKAFASGRPADFPAPKAKVAKPVRYGTAFWHEGDNGLWLVRRPAKGLLGGMPALPGPEWTADRPASAGQTLARVSHVFTHFRLELDVVAGRCAPEGEGWWVPIDAVEQAGLPTLYRRAIAAVIDGRRERRAA